jgi:GxxExxY protein
VAKISQETKSITYKTIAMKSNNGIIKNYGPIPEELNQIGTQIVDAAYHVHLYLGPGLLEKVYEICFCYELEKRGILCQRQITLPIKYKEMTFEEGLRLDVLVANSIICELKALENVNPVWEAQILSQLKITGIRLGYLINFDVPKISMGIKRFAL